MEEQKLPAILYIYELPSQEGEEAYDHAMAAATMQGVINREQPALYVLSPWSKMPAYWLDVLSRNGGWLAKRPRRKLNSLDDLATLCQDIEEALAEDGYGYIRVGLDWLDSTGIEGKARELIIYLRNRGKLDYLVEAVRQARPGVI